MGKDLFPRIKETFVQRFLEFSVICFLVLNYANFEMQSIKGDKDSNRNKDNNLNIPIPERIRSSIMVVKDIVEEHDISQDVGESCFQIAYI